MMPDSCTLRALRRLLALCKDFEVFSTTYILYIYVLNRVETNIK